MLKRPEKREYMVHARERKGRIKFRIYCMTTRQYVTEELVSKNDAADQLYFFEKRAFEEYIGATADLRVARAQEVGWECPFATEGTLNESEWAEEASPEE